MRRRMHCTRLASILLLSASSCRRCRGRQISGTVTNGTTGKPAAGVAVTLVDPMGGMAEIATAKSDAQGRFKFDTPAAQGPRLARAEKRRSQLLQDDYAWIDKCRSKCV